MTTDEWKSVAKILNALYDDGHYMFEAQDVAKMQAWYSCLSDLDYKVVCVAVKNLAMKSPYKPKISDIRQEYMNIVSTPALGEQEAWEIVRDAIRNGIYGAEDEFNKFPPEVQAAVVTPWALSEWAMLASTEIDTVIQSQFKRSYRSTIERDEKERVLGAIGAKAGSMAQLAENVAKRLEDKQ
jgi:hypothetical protein